MIELNFPNPVSQEKDFYGRRAELDRIERAFLSRSHKPVIVLGERRIGKTSLQLVVARRLRSKSGGHLVPLLLPPASAIRSFEDYGKEILQSLGSYLGKSLQEAGLMDGKGRFQLSSVGQFGEAAVRLLEGVSDKTFIVCLDEFDAVLLSCDADEADRILALTEHIVERSELPLLIYFTMTRPPERMRGSYFSPLIAHSEVIELGPFLQAEVVEMVTGLLKGQMELEDAAMGHLFHLSGGHPYFVKLLLDCMLMRYGKGPGLIVSRPMLEEIVPAAVHDPRARHALDNVYKVHFNQTEQQLVLLLAKREDSVAGEELKVLGGEFVTAARRLERRGYLTQREDQSYDFRIEFLGHWLRGWDEYDEELERLKLAHAPADPWSGSQPTVVSNEDLRRHGLRPDR